MADAVGKDNPTGTGRKFPTLFWAGFAEAGVFLHGVVAAVHEVVVGGTVGPGKVQSAGETTHSASERISAARAGQTNGLGEMRADGFKSLRGVPDAVLRRVQV